MEFEVHSSVEIMHLFSIRNEERHISPLDHKNIIQSYVICPLVTPVLRTDSDCCRDGSTMVDCLAVALGIRLPGFEHCLSHLLTMWP